MRTDIRTFTDDRDDLRWGTKFLGALLAIPLAGVLGLPLLVLLLLLFAFNPGGLGQRLGQARLLQSIPGFRSGRRSHMALASLIYLLPLSVLGILIISVDGMMLGLHLSF
jgi:hypothetical protein